MSRAIERSDFGVELPLALPGHDGRSDPDTRRSAVFAEAPKHRLGDRSTWRWFAVSSEYFATSRSRFAVAGEMNVNVTGDLAGGRSPLTNRSNHLPVERPVAGQSHRAAGIDDAGQPSDQFGARMYLSQMVAAK